MPQRSHSNKRHATGNRRMRSTDSRPLVDVCLALDLLAAAVAERGEDYVYPPAECSRYFSIDDAAPTLLEQALSSLSLDETDVGSLRRGSVRVLHEDGRLPVRLTIGALLIFDVVQRSESRGLAWGGVLDRVEKAVVRILQLLPGSAFDVAPEGLPRPDGALTAAVEPHIWAA